MDARDGPAGSGGGPCKVLRFAGFQRCVRDLRRSMAFYCEGLGFVDEGAGSLRLGEETIVLVEDAGAMGNDDGRYAHGKVDTGFQHLAIVATDMEGAYRRLQDVAPRVVSLGGPVVLPASAGGVTAFKFLDPDGRPLELIQFPAGTGDDRWQRSAVAGPTVGIDHSAIVVADTERSIVFYRDELGFDVKARQRNAGPSQVRLDGIQGVEVDVVSLQPARDPTPHLELLGYVVPAPAPGIGSDRLVWWADTRGGADLREVTDPDGHRHLLWR